MHTRIAPSDRYQPLVWSGPSAAQARTHTPLVPQSHRFSTLWRPRLRHARAVALQWTTAALLALSLLPSTAAAIEPEKQPIYVNLISTGLCGTDPAGAFPAAPCPVPAGQRLIIEHVSGYAFLPASTDTTIAVAIAIKDPQLGLGGVGELAFHTFVATKTHTSGGTDVFAFSTPFRMTLNPGATFYFAPADNVAVSGYLVKVP